MNHWGLLMLDRCICVNNEIGSCYEEIFRAM
jgi:hypothetical protein